MSRLTMESEWNGIWNLIFYSFPGNAKFSGLKNSDIETFLSLYDEFYAKKNFSIYLTGDMQSFLYNY